MAFGVVAEPSQGGGEALRLVLVAQGLLVESAEPLLLPQPASALPIIKALSRIARVFFFMFISSLINHNYENIGAFTWIFSP